MNDTTYFASTLHTHRTAELRREAEIRELRAAQADDAPAAATPADGPTRRGRHVRHARRSDFATAR